MSYPLCVKTTSRLQKYRIHAGLTMRELAKQIGVDHSNIRFWEQSGKIPRSELLTPIAKALGVTVQELLGENVPSRTAVPRGRLGVVIEEISKLPRNQQSKILDTVETLLAGQHARKETKAS